MNGTKYITSAFNEIEFNELNVFNELDVFNELCINELNVFNAPTTALAQPKRPMTHVLRLIKCIYGTTNFLLLVYWALFMVSVVCPKKL